MQPLSTQHTPCDQKTNLVARFHKVRTKYLKLLSDQLAADQNPLSRVYRRQSEVIHLDVLSPYTANRDARAPTSNIESVDYGRVHRLDRIRRQ